jgi:hypothetical protein
VALSANTLWAKNDELIAANCKRLSDTLRGNAFSVIRGFDEYDQGYGRRLLPLLTTPTLRKKVWIDFGSGTSHSQLDFLKRVPDADVSLIGIVHTKPVKGPPNLQKTKILNAQIDQLNEAIAKKEIIYLERDLNHPLELETLADAGTDYFGPISYATDLSGVIQNEIDSIRVGGPLLVRAALGHTDIHIGGQRFSIYSFLRMTPGLQVTRISDTAFVVVKTQQNVRITPLELISINSELSLPVRSFRIKN